MGLDRLTMAMFRARLDEQFAMTVPGGALDLRLMAVEDLGPSPARQAFSVLFAGPDRPVQPQGIYRLDNAAMGRLDLFLVPLGGQGGAFRYQAVFA